MKGEHMKNLIISILSMQIITGLSFWEYSTKYDRVFIGVALTIVLWVVIETLDEFVLTQRREYKFREAMLRNFKEQMEEIGKLHRTLETLDERLDVIDLTDEKEVG